MASVAGVLYHGVCLIKSISHWAKVSEAADKAGALGAALGEAAACVFIEAIIGNCVGIALSLAIGAIAYSVANLERRREFR